MSLFALDSDTFSLLQIGNSNIASRVANCAAGEVAITIITVDEQLRGWFTEVRRARRPSEIARAYNRLGRSVAYLSKIQILPYTETAIATFEALRKMKLNVGSNDLRIAAISLEHQATIVTRNVRDFVCVPGLKVEDWSTI